MFPAWGAEVSASPPKRLRCSAFQGPSQLSPEAGAAVDLRRGRLQVVRASRAAGGAKDWTPPVRTGEVGRSLGHPDKLGK